MINEERIEEYVKKCIHCGFCKPGCPMYTIYLEEKWSARGLIFLTRDLLKKRISLNDWKLLEVIYACTLCGNCLKRCPANINTPEIVLNLRKIIVSSNIFK